MLQVVDEQTHVKHDDLHDTARITMVPVDRRVAVTHTVDMDMTFAQQVARVTDSCPPDVAPVESLHVVCGWCKLVMHAGDTSQPTSHGICKQCAARFTNGGK